eukprot:2056195-Rhodomonas_salina.3
MAVEIDFIPQSVIAKIDKLGRKKARGGIGRTPSFGTSGGEGMDPFPALSRLQLKDLFEHKPANSFVIHSVEDDEHSSSPGFRPLWVTYNSESGLPPCGAIASGCKLSLTASALALMSAALP